MLLVVLTCVAPRLRRPIPPTYPADFNVYYAASQLVRHGDAAQLYTGADTGADPQKLIAPATSPIYRAAHTQGLSFVGLYLYPPLLADLLLPLTFVDLRTATYLWFALNIGFLLLTAVLLARLLKMPLVSFGGAVILISLLCFTPVLQCLVDGQITILLLLLWTAGLVLYQEDSVYAAGALFALATAVKLTPGIVLVPLLIWRKWRIVGAFLATLLCLVLVCLWVDTPHASRVYLCRVLPAMSGAVPFLTNYSLPAATQRLVTLLRTGSIAPFPPTQAPNIVRAGRAAAAGTLAILVALVTRARNTGKQGQVLVVGLTALMAPILSPVSWFHAYATAFLAFALLWRECLTEPDRNLYLFGLTAVSVLLGTAVSENLITLLESDGHQALASCLQLAQLIGGTVLVFVRIWRLNESTATTAVPSAGLQPGIPQL